MCLPQRECQELARTESIFFQLHEARRRVRIPNKQYIPPVQTTYSFVSDILERVLQLHCSSNASSKRIPIMPVKIISYLTVLIEGVLSLNIALRKLP